MAEESAAKAAAATEENKARNPVLLYAMIGLNMAVVGVVAFMLHASRQKEAKEPGIKDVIRGEHEAQKGEGAKGEGHGESGEKSDDLIGKTIPLEQFLVNLAGNRGRGLLKVNMELEVDGEKVMEEIEKRKPQVRDIVIILLSSKSYAQVSGAEGKETLRDEIRDTVNSFLTKGKIKKVLFTEFIYN